MALKWEHTKSGSPGEPTILLGKPTRTNIAGPFKSRELAFNDVIERNNVSKPVTS